MGKSNAAKTRSRTGVARPRKGAPSVAAVSRKAARVGIELDGGIAHIVTVAPDGAVHYQQIEQANNAAALSEALKALGRNDVVRIALTSEHQSVRLLSVPKVPDRALPIAIRTVAEEHMPMAATGIAVAGLMTGEADPAASDRPMTIAAVSAADVIPLRHQVGPGRTLSVSSFLLPTDGLYLRLARASAELVLVRDGAPAAVRSLRSGGVASISQELHDDQPTVYLGTNTGDTVVDAYVDAVVSDVRRTIVFWRREGMHVPDQLMIIGEGAALAPLEARLREASYEILPVPVPQGLHVEGLDAAQRPVAFQALAAALVDITNQPMVALMDSSITDVEVVKKRDMLPILVAASAALIAVGMLGYTYMQSTKARARVTAAKTAQVQAQANLAPLQPYLNLKRDVETARAEVKKLRDAEPMWPKVLQGVYDSAPQGAQIKALGFTKNAATIAVTASGSMGDNGDWAFRPVAAWQDRFLEYQRQGGGTIVSQDAWVPSLTKDKDGKIDLSFTASIDTSAFKPTGEKK